MIAQQWRFERGGRSRSRIAIAVNAVLFVILPRAMTAQVELKAGKECVSISIEGKPFSDFYLAPTLAKPFLWPLRSATGVAVTRKWPIEQAEGDSHDHPHHKGLWIGYGDINGINFWETEPESKISPENPQKKGTVRLKQLGRLKPGKKSGSLEAVFAWRDPDGREVLEERRTLTFYDDKDVRRIDVETELTARTPIVFGDTKEGFFAIRVADSMTGKNGGLLTNSEGATTEKDVWGKRADWVDYDGTVEGHKFGIAILDDPRNLHHPPRWHARDYGLFAVNPFGVKEFEPQSTEKGGYQLENGKTLRFRYRVIIHTGDVSKKTVADWYGKFRKGAGK